jgi:hypothetical protein
MAEAIMPILSGVIEEIAPILEGFSEMLAENGELFGALILAGALFVGILRVLQAALVITGGAGAAAAAGTSGFLALLFSGLGVIAATIGALAGLAAYLFNVGNTVEELNPVFRGFLEGLARLVYGTSFLIRSVVITALAKIEVLINGVVAAVESGYNAIARAFDKDTISIPRLQIPKPELPDLNELRREMGLITEAITPRRPLANVGYGPNQFAPNFLQQRQAKFFTTPLLPTGFEEPDFLRGGIPFSPQGLESQRFLFERGISGFPGLGGGVAPDNRKYEITVNAGMGTDPSQLGDEIYSILLQYDRYAAPVFQSARQ